MTATIGTPQGLLFVGSQFMSPIFHEKTLKSYSVFFVLIIESVGGNPDKKIFYKVSSTIITLPSGHINNYGMLFVGNIHINGKPQG